MPGHGRLALRISGVSGLLTRAIEAIRPLDEAAMAAARERQARLTKPPGSLGALEELSVRLAGLAGRCPPPMLTRPALAVFAGDHGVHAQGVTPWPQEVTAQMVANFLAGGAVINAFARQIGATITVVDVGVADPLDWLAERPAASSGVAEPVLRRRKVRPGTRDFAVEPALTVDEALAAVEVGIAVADELIDAGADVLLTGDMGIANTTPAAALIAACTGAAPSAVTGRGTGIDDDTLAHKTAVIEAAIDKYGVGGDPLATLAAVGGLEHAALAGFALGGAARRVPVILDGVIACAAALIAVRLAPDALGALVAGHRSAEPGASVALADLGLVPLVDLGLRLGEGSGAALAAPIVASAVRVLHEVATFDSAGVSEK
jgi:nicotinate-nucleotide--dimethylbenzimidazole phosphoribosyltransferase